MTNSLTVAATIFLVTSTRINTKPFKTSSSDKLSGNYQKCDDSAENKLTKSSHVFLNRKNNSIHYEWYVQTRQDVGDFVVEVRPLQAKNNQTDLISEPIVEKNIGYGIRSDDISGLQDPNNYAVCIRARNTLGYLRPWKPNQCQRVISNFSPDLLPCQLSILAFIALSLFYFA